MGRTLFMPDPILTWISFAPPSKVTRGREYLIQKNQGAALHAGVKITKFSFDSTFVTFFELVLTFY
jgi:hypothetical protein